MKPVIFLAFILLHTFQIFAFGDVIDDLSQGMVKCYGKLNEDEATVVSESDENDYLKENSPVLNKFYECSFRECGFINGDNKINFHLLRNALLQDSSISKKEIDKAIHICKMIKSVNLGDRIVKLLNCLARNKALH
ncbi:hypothetical protein RI129_009623 [Pyrocoelia pectoralis]|uniref:Uncharacterized protein n=1 Tax=Pyrocoelia pectoralis TaxID=417401 RepID=A0AAN7ZIA9_9COLE